MTYFQLQIRIREYLTKNETKHASTIYPKYIMNYIFKKTKQQLILIHHGLIYLNI